MSHAERERPSFGAAYDRLRSAQKSPSGAPTYSRYVNRPLGRVLAATAYRSGLTPDQVTYLSAACTFTGIAVLALVPTTGTVGVVVTVALVLGYALDAADGQLARLRGGGSTTGEWLDHMIDSVKIVTLHLAVLIAAYRFFDLPSRAWLLVPVGFTVVASVHFFGMILVDQLVRLHLAGDQNGASAPSSRTAGRPLLTVLKVPLDYGFLCVSFLLLAMPLVFFAVYSVLALGWTCYLALALGKWRSDVAGLSVAGRRSQSTVRAPR